MNNKIVFPMRILGGCILLSAFTACTRNERLNCSDEAIVEIERRFRYDTNSMKNVVFLRQMTVRASISNAFAKAHERRRLGAEGVTLPVYCLVGDTMKLYRDTPERERGFTLKIRGFNLRAALDDLDSIWLAVVKSNISSGCCEVVTSSLRNITYGDGGSGYVFHGDKRPKGHIWNFTYRCYDPRLGWEDDDPLIWREEVASGRRKFYLMTEGHRLGGRFGRKIWPMQKWKLFAECATKCGDLIELVPVAHSDEACLLECR